MKILIGNTGLVGQTLKKNIKFDFEFNTSNIHTYEHIVKDGCELWLSCLPATKWLVNQNIKKDLSNIDVIMDVISGKKYKSIVLISTIDVYCDSPNQCDESYNPNFGKFSYGTNRLLFEHMIGEYVQTEKLKIYRLPALFNNKIKKNVLYDLIHDNNVNQIDGNSYFQWYNLDNLHQLIEDTFDSDRKVLNVFTEPIKTEDIVKLFPQHLDKIQYRNNSVVYDYRTNSSDTGYIQDKQSVLKEIEDLVNEISVK